MVWARPGIINLILLLYSAVIKIYIRAKINLFCHVCNNTRGLEIAKNVMRAIFILGISGPNRQLSWILRLLLKSKLFVTNLLRFTVHIKSHFASWIKNQWFLYSMIFIWQQHWLFKYDKKSLFNIKTSCFDIWLNFIFLNFWCPKIHVTHKCFIFFSE